MVVVEPGQHVEYYSQSRAKFMPATVVEFSPVEDSMVLLVKGVRRKRLSISSTSFKILRERGFSWDLESTVGMRLEIEREFECYSLGTVLETDPLNGTALVDFDHSPKEWIELSSCRIREFAGNVEFLNRPMDGPTAEDDGEEDSPFHPQAPTNPCTTVALVPVKSTTPHKNDNGSRTSPNGRRGRSLIPTGKVIQSNGHSREREVRATRNELIQQYAAGKLEHPPPPAAGLKKFGAHRAVKATPPAILPTQDQVLREKPLGIDFENLTDPGHEEWSAVHFFEVRDPNRINPYWIDITSGLSQWEPPLWVDYFDENTNLTYYMNSVTGMSQWRRPWDFKVIVRYPPVQDEFGSRQKGAPHPPPGSMIKQDVKDETSRPTSAARSPEAKGGKATIPSIYATSGLSSPPSGTSPKHKGTISLDDLPRVRSPATSPNASPIKDSGNSRQWLTLSQDSVDSSTPMGQSQSSIPRVAQTQIKVSPGKPQSPTSKPHTRIEQDIGMLPSNIDKHHATTSPLRPTGALEAVGGGGGFSSSGFTAKEGTDAAQGTQRRSKVMVGSSPKHSVSDPVSKQASSIDGPEQLVTSDIGPEKQGLPGKELQALEKDSYQESLRPTSDRISSPSSSPKGRFQCLQPVPKQPFQAREDKEVHSSSDNSDPGDLPPQVFAKTKSPGKGQLKPLTRPTSLVDQKDPPSPSKPHSSIDCSSSNSTLLGLSGLSEAKESMPRPSSPSPLKRPLADNPQTFSLDHAAHVQSLQSKLEPLYSTESK